MATLIGMAPDRKPEPVPFTNLMRQARAETRVEVKAQRKTEREAETRLLNRVRAVLTPNQKTSGAVASGPPEQALATY